MIVSLLCIMSMSARSLKRLTCLICSLNLHVPVSGNENLTEEYRLYEVFEHVLSFYNFCAGIVAVALNLFVLYIFLNKHGWGVHGGDLFVLGLTFADILTGFVLIFSISLVFLDFRRTLCLFQICSLQFSMLSSAMFVTLLTVDRFLKIVNPFAYLRLCSEEIYARVLSVLVFFLSYVMGYLPLTGVGETPDLEDEDWEQCNYLRVLNLEFRVTYVILMGVPILTAIFLYTKIFQVALKQARSIAKIHGVQTRIPRGRYLKIIILMAGLYIAFYIPPALVNIISPAVPKATGPSVKSKVLFHLCATGIIANAIVNAIIYPYTMPLVKNTFQSVIGLPEEAIISWIELSCDETRKTIQWPEMENQKTGKRKKRRKTKHSGSSSDRRKRKILPQQAQESGSPETMVDAAGEEMSSFAGE